MTWLVWRQHRTNALVVAGALGLLAVLLVAKASTEAATYQHVILPCFSASHQLYNLHGCQGVTTDFSNDYGLVGVFAYLNFLPALLGMFIGAPLVAREIERGTHRFVWSQGITRLRWFAVKLGWLTAGALVATAGLILLVTWWRQPVDLIQGHLAADAFDFEGPVLGAYVLFALAVGTLAGVVIRRTIAAMAVTLGVFLLVRLPVEALRAHLLPTVTHSAGVLSSYQTPAGAWLLDNGYQDAAGHHLSQVQVNALFDQAQAVATDKQGVFQYLAGHHISNYWVYLPADRFWTLQLIETAFFLTLAAAAFALALVLLRRSSA
jgi:hypothetical protein